MADRENTRRPSEFFAKLKEQLAARELKEPPSRSDWLTIRTMFVSHVPAPLAAPVAERLLSRREKQVYVLLILDFDNYDIYWLMNLSAQQLTNLKACINRKLFGDSAASTLQQNLERARKEAEDTPL